MKILTIEEPNQEPVEWELTDRKRRQLKEKYGLEECDIQHMEEGHVVFHNDIGFSIEEK